MPKNSPQKGFPMIISASRRTDIPNYYSHWFYNRIKEGYLYVRNPMNPHQVSKIILSPETIDCMVFWTKNPEPMIPRLDELRAYHYYFQFTLTGYGKEIEPGVPHKKETMLSTFQKLSQTIGSQKVIWRYDPILFTDTYTLKYHLQAFEQIASALEGYTHRCVISFVDTYAKNKKSLQQLHAYDLKDSELLGFAKALADIAHSKGLTVGSCGEAADLSGCGIEHNCCIDQKLIEEICGYKIKGSKDKNQRRECGCMESVDIGAYDTCKNGCLYCYANYSRERVNRYSMLCDPDSPLLCGTLGAEDKVTERPIKSLRL